MKNLNLVHEFDTDIIGANNAPTKIRAIKDIILPAITSVPQGANYEEMTKRVGLIQKIKDAVKGGCKDLLLENDEHAELVRALKGQRYLVIDPKLYGYIKEIAESPDVAVKLESLSKKSKAG